MIFNPDAQSKFVHTSIAGYVTAAIFVAGISAWYMLKKRHMDLAKRSFRMAALYGVLATIGVITLGDALGFVAAQAQPTKLAAMEGLWKTEPGPMPFNLIAFPDQSLQENKGEVQVPYAAFAAGDALGERQHGRLRCPAEAGGTAGARTAFPRCRPCRRCRRIRTTPVRSRNSTPTKKTSATASWCSATRPTSTRSRRNRFSKPRRTASRRSPPVFWSFRAMVGFGLLMLAFFVLAVIYTLRNKVQDKRWFLIAAAWMIPIPFLANEAGWLVAELGRQPWTVFGMLPTWMTASTHSVGYMAFSLIGFVLLYTIFIAVEMYLMVRSIRQGPQEPGGRRAHRHEATADAAAGLCNHHP